MKTVVQWNAAPCSLVETERRFRAGYGFLNPNPADYVGGKHFSNVDQSLAD
jgi:hypothetical protein